MSHMQSCIGEAGLISAIARRVCIDGLSSHLSSSENTRDNREEEQKSSSLEDSAAGQDCSEDGAIDVNTEELNRALASESSMITTSQYQ